MITNTTRRPTPRGPFEGLARRALGKNYELSLVFCGPALSRRLNRTYRGKDKSTNVLSFQISKNFGEIFIDLTFAKTDEEVLELFIHGLMHLKGMVHGAKMDRAEKQLHETTRSRHRRRHRSSQGGHR